MCVGFGVLVAPEQIDLKHAGVTRPPCLPARLFSSFHSFFHPPLPIAVVYETGSLIKSYFTLELPSHSVFMFAS